MICLRERGAEDGLPKLSEGSPDLVGVTEGIDATSAVTDLFRDSTGRTSSSIIDEGDWLIAIGQITLMARRLKNVDERKEFNGC